MGDGLLNPWQGQRRHGRLLWFVMLACAVSGCSSGEGIRQYTVARAPAADRMLAAIVPAENEAWFFKVSGPNQAVAGLEVAFSDFLRELRFADGEPAWELPAGWSAKPAGGMRFATLEIATADAPLEVSVTRLPLQSEADLPGYLLSNINRWREQLQLPRITGDALAKESEEIALAGESGLVATVVNLAGNLSGGMAGQSGSGGGPVGPFAGAAAAPPRSTAERPTEIQFEAPEDWEPGEKNVSRGGITIRRAAVYNVSDGDQTAEVTITSLPAAAGDLLANVNRWRRQVQLGPFTAEELSAAQKPITVGGTKSAYVELVGPAQAVLGIIALDKGTAWFIKLQGDHDLAIKERERFRQFAESIRFDKEDGKPPEE